MADETLNACLRLSTIEITSELFMQINLKNTLYNNKHHG